MGSYVGRQIDIYMFKHEEGGRRNMEKLSNYLLRKSHVQQETDRL